jgi:hypothetical protein
MGWCHPRQLAILDASKASTGRAAMDKPSNADAHEPPVLSGEVARPPRSVGGRQYRSAPCHGDGTMTLKQEAFCQGIVFRGLSLSDAFRGSYDVSRMKPASVHRKACELAQNVKIVARIAKLRAETSQDLRQMRTCILFQLRHEMMTARSSSARIQAAKTLLRACGPAPKVAGDQKSLRAELEKRLDALLPPGRRSG